MSALRKRLKRPETYLFVLLALALLAVIDSYRMPAIQSTARLYIGTVHVYQAVGRPLLSRRIRCRYRPTCSDYSIAAVHNYGIWRGLIMTVNRINSCTVKVPLGTYDPVPPPAQ